MSEEDGTLHHRSARALPIELQQQCAIQLEEGLYTQALALLSDLLTSGISCSTIDRPIPAFVPPPIFLSFLSTLILHPSTTTHARPADKVAAANQALLYLRNLHSLVGPVNARFSSAFVFASKTSYRDRGTKRRHDGEVRDNRHSDDVEPLNTRLAQEQALWNRAEDFWHAVGWAFNCAVVSKTRWERWKLWLELMLDVLEADLDERRREEDEDGKAAASTLVAESLLVQYVTSLGGSIGYNERRKIMRAILTRGTSKDVSEFKEIWKDETKEKDDKGASKGLRSQRHPDGLTYEDFSDESEEDAEVMVEGGQARLEHYEPKRRRRDRSSLQVEEENMSASSSGTGDGIEMYGGMEAVLLRKRLIRLLISLSDVDSTVFGSTDILLDLFSEYIRPLPLPVFAAFVLPSEQYAFSPAFNTSLCKELFRPLLAAAAPRMDTNYVDQADMETRYLPFAANSASAADNAKVSLLLEALLWLLKYHDKLRPAGLKQAVIKGIQTRQEKVKPGRSGKGHKKEADEEHDAARLWLDMSAKRLEMLMNMLGSPQALRPRR